MTSDSTVPPISTGRKITLKAAISALITLFVTIQVMDLVASNKFYLLKGTINKKASEEGHDLDFLIERIVGLHSRMIDADYYAGVASVRANVGDKKFYALIPLPNPAEVESGSLRKSGSLNYKIPVVDVSLSDAIYFFAEFFGFRRKELYLSIRCGAKCDESDTYLGVFSAYTVVPIVFRIDDKRARELFSKVNVINPLVANSDLEDRLVQAIAIEIMGITNSYRRATFFVNAPDELPVSKSSNLQFYPDSKPYLSMAVLAELNKGEIYNVVDFACFKKVYENPSSVTSAAIAVASALTGNGLEAREALGRLAHRKEFEEFNKEFEKVFGQTLDPKSGRIGCRR